MRSIVSLTIRTCMICVFFGVGWVGFDIIALSLLPFWLETCKAILVSSTSR